MYLFRLDKGTRGDILHIIRKRTVVVVYHPHKGGYRLFNLDQALTKKHKFQINPKTPNKRKSK